MKKSKLNAQGINDWMNNHWSLYASEIYCEKLLRLWTNGSGNYRVVYGGEVLYEGCQISHALKAWKTV